MFLDNWAAFDDAAPPPPPPPPPPVIPPTVAAGFVWGVPVEYPKRKRPYEDSDEDEVLLIL